MGIIINVLLVIFVAFMFGKIASEASLSNAINTELMIYDDAVEKIKEKDDEELRAIVRKRIEPKWRAYSK